MGRHPLLLDFLEGRHCRTSQIDEVRALPVKGTGAPLPRYLSSGACTDGRVRSVARDRFDVNQLKKTPTA